MKVPSCKCPGLRLALLVVFALTSSSGCMMAAPGNPAVPGAGIGIGVAPGAAQGCTDDSGCKGGRSCQQGKCVTPLSNRVVAAAQAGDVSLETVEAVAKGGGCVDLRGLVGKLQELASDDRARGAFAAQLGADSGLDPGLAYGRWVMAVHRSDEACGRKLAADWASNIAYGYALVSEPEVEAALKGHNCRKLMAIDAAKLWPFKQQFSKEIEQRQFQEAEVTRRLWLNSLTSYKDDCIKRLSMRQQLTIDAQTDKLRRIVGLDDTTLINLRGQLLTAMEKGKAQDIASYSRAISEREASLDSLNRAYYEQKAKDLEAQLADARKRPPAPATVVPTVAQPGTGTAAANANTAAQDAANAVDAGSKALDVANTIFSLF